MCLGAVLMLLSTFRMDKFLRSTLPGSTVTPTSCLIMHLPLLACSQDVMVMSLSFAKPALVRLHFGVIAAYVLRGESSLAP